MTSPLKLLSSDPRSKGILGLISIYRKHPSFDEENDVWTKAFDFISHRPDCEAHISLQSPIIGRYFDNIRNPNYPFDHVDTEAALELCSSMSQNNIKRDHRRQLLRDELCKYLNIPAAFIGPIIYPEKTEYRYEDGGWEVPIPIPQKVAEYQPHVAMLLSLEIQSELAGKEPVGMHNVANYMDNLVKNLMATIHSPSPCLLLTVAGPYLNIDVATFGIATMVDPVVSFMPLLVTKYDPYIMLRSAQILRATKTCLHELDAYYRNEVTELPQIERQQLGFPYMREVVCTFFGQAVKVHFQYVSVFAVDKLVYRVKVTHVEHTLSVEQFSQCPIQVGGDMVIKFTRTYCMEAHLHCYNYHAGAPELYAIGNLPGGWIFVCMEYIVRQYWPFLAGRADVMHPLRRLVEHLHSANYVHGDINTMNVLVVDPPGGVPRVCLCDFDWAGLEGVATYPAFVSPSTTLPEEVRGMMHIRKEHDLSALKTEFKPIE